jgi:hypothetical protein
LKRFLFFSFAASALCANELELKSYIGYEYKSYFKKSVDKRDYNSALTFQNELKYSFGDSKFYSKIDIVEDADESQRDYIDFEEFYIVTSLSDFDFYFGKRVIFLGSLEAYNMVDIFNRQNYQRDSLSEYKKGVYLTGINYYFEDDSRLNVYIKSFEEDIKFLSKSSPYYPFGTNTYDKELLFANGNEQPSLLLTYAKTYDEYITADVCYGFFYGYDDHLLSKKSGNKYQSMLFQSMKFFTYDTFVVGAALLKLEASFTKIQDDAHYDLDDFYDIGIGAEYTLERIIGNHNLGIIVEYYKADDPFTFFDNDLFFALRYSLNDKDSSEFLGGIVKDLQSDEVSAYAKYEGRLSDMFKISADIRYLKGENYLDEHLRLGCEIKYYF